LKARAGAGFHELTAMAPAQEILLGKMRAKGRATDIGPPVDFLDRNRRMRVFSRQFETAPPARAYEFLQHDDRSIRRPRPHPFLVTKYAAVQY
jgi:hypothetical protein